MAPSSRPLYRFTKRAMDLLGSLVLLLFLGPLMLILWAFVRARMGRPAVFRQERAGLHGHPFVIYKFRSMIDAFDANGEQLPDTERITPFGRLLRRSSLDELPQILNVLKGEMSFVGPRPLYMEYVPRYSPEQRRRLEVKPGITGLAQINGRNTSGWEGRLGLDVQYVDQASIGLDLLILLRTVKKVIRAEGVPSTGLDLNKKFQGTQEDSRPTSVEPNPGAPPEA